MGTETLKDTVYEQLSKLLSKKSCHPTIIAGDFNARICHRSAEEHPHIGPHFLHKDAEYDNLADPDTQDNRDRFITLLQSHSGHGSNRRRGICLCVMLPCAASLG